MKQKKTIQTNNGLDIDDWDNWDLQDYKSEPCCSITCAKEVRYSDVVECAKTIGDEMAKSVKFQADIVITYCGEVHSIRRFVPADYNEETYEKYLDVVDPYRPTYDGYKKDPIILKFGYYTDWIRIL